MPRFKMGMTNKRAPPARTLSYKRTKGTAWNWMVVITATGAGYTTRTASDCLKLTDDQLSHSHLILGN